MKNRRNGKMATSAVSSNPAVSEVEETVSTSEYNQNEAVRSENVDYYRFSRLEPSKDDPNKEVLVTRVYSNPSDKLKADMAKDGYVVDFVQTVIRKTAGNPDGFLQIVPDPEECTGIFNRGLAQKLSQKANANFGDTKADNTPSWKKTEEPYDPSDWLNEPTDRRNLTQDERIERDLLKSGLDKETIMLMFAAKAAQAAKIAAAAKAASSQSAAVSETASA